MNHQPPLSYGRSTRPHDKVEERMKALQVKKYEYVFLLSFLTKYLLHLLDARADAGGGKVERSQGIRRERIRAAEHNDRARPEALVDSGEGALEDALERPISASCAHAGIDRVYIPKAEIRRVLTRQGGKWEGGDKRSMNSSVDKALMIRHGHSGTTG